MTTRRAPSSTTTSTCSAFRCGQHHAIVYGNALQSGGVLSAAAAPPQRHAARGFSPRLRGRLAQRGFLTREHEEQRKRAGLEALTRFYHERRPPAARLPPWSRSSASSWDRRGCGALRPRERDVRGRRHRGLQVERRDGAEARDQRARESLQLKIYALAWEKMTGRLPVRVELAFLEIRAGRASPADRRPTWRRRGRRSRPPPTASGSGASSRRRDIRSAAYCAYNQICPSTATQE